MLLLMSMGVRTELADLGRTFEEIVITKGFSVEKHSVITSDGYILALYRIPSSLAA